MSIDFKRTLNEVITLYELEPTLKSIYVEGRTDGVILNYFLKSSKIRDVVVYEIDSAIDFSECYTHVHYLQKNNKEKLLYFAEKLTENFSDTLLGVACIIDKDFDEILGAKTNNFYVFYTDFNSIELYLFNENCIEKFYTISLHGFPVSPNQTLKELAKILIDLFLFRFVLWHKGVEALHPNIFEKLIKIEKNGTVHFDFQQYLERLLNKCNKLSEKDDIYTQFTSMKEMVIAEVKDFIRGHDFIYIFFLYVDKIKNHVKFNQDTFERSLFLSFEYQEYLEYSLFKEIINKFNITS